VSGRVGEPVRRLFDPDLPAWLWWGLVAIGAGLVLLAVAILYRP
jgi:hypothetical protein